MTGTFKSTLNIPGDHHFIFDNQNAHNILLTAL
jgi:hypothetical protein